MDREIIEAGPSVAEAIDTALEKLGVQQDAVDYEVLDEGGSSTDAGRPAKVRVWLRDGTALPRSSDPEISDAEPEDDDGEPGDEELDALADAASEVLTGILEKLGMSADIDEYEGDEGEIILDVVGDEELGVLIGRHGKTLDALQVVVGAILGRSQVARHPLVVDVSGYRYRQRVKLEEIARRAADRAARTGRPVTLRPMSAFERRVVHVCLRDDRRVVTASQGEEPARQVVISPR